MSIYAFKKRPPKPRTRFKNTGQQTPCPHTEEQKAFEHAMIAILMRFPQAYRAVMDEVQRLEGTGPAAKTEKC